MFQETCYPSGSVNKYVNIWGLSCSLTHLGLFFSWERFGIFSTIGFAQTITTLYLLSLFPESIQSGLFLYELTCNTALMIISLLEIICCFWCPETGI